jgi:transcriptional regulator with XRE-family HTH domain
MSPKGNKELGRFVQKHREQAGLSLRDLEEQSGVTYSYIAKIERGDVDAPSADKLLRLAKVIGVEVEDLYALAGYVMPEGLPEFKVYLRTKHPDLTKKEVRDLERHLSQLIDEDEGKS